MGDSPLLFNTVLVLIGAELLQVLQQSWGANLYDLRQTRQQRQRPGKQRQPRLAVTIIARNDAATLEACLQSVFSGRYRPAVLVIDNASTDGTAEVVKAFQRRYPKRIVKLQTKRHVSDQAVIIHAGRRRQPKDAVILEITGHTTLGSQALQHCRQAFAGDAELSSVQPALVSTDAQRRLLGFFQQYEKAVIGYSLKATKLLYPAELPRAYRRPDKNSRNQASKVRYLSGIVLHDIAPVTFKSFLSARTEQARQRFNLLLELNRRQAFPGAMLLSTMLLTIAFRPLLLGYLLYLAISFQQPLLLGLAWVVVSLSLTIAVWAQPSLKFRQKLSLSLLAPALFIPFVLSTLVDVIAGLYVIVGRLFRPLASSQKGQNSFAADKQRQYQGKAA